MLLMACSAEGGFKKGQEVPLYKEQADTCEGSEDES